ncbi:MAG: MFS transporter [Gammaproteobacteria bacterium]|nr:MFS transporter [Gammaproteobacteria bacterium]
MNNTDVITNNDASNDLTNGDSISNVAKKDDYVNSKKSFVSFCSLGLSGILIFTLLPLLLGTISTTLNLTPVQAGSTGSIYFAGYTLVALTSFIWFNRVNWKNTALFGYALTTVALLIASIFENYNSVLITMALLGFAGAIFYATSLGIVAKTNDVDRNYALKIAPEQLIPAIFVAILPWLIIEKWGMIGLLISILIIYLTIGLTSPWIVKNTPIKEAIDWKAIAKNKQGLLSLLSLLISFSGFIGLWAFMEIIAREYHFSEDSSALIIMASLVISGLTPLCSGLIGDRFGRTKPLVFALIMLILSFMLLFLDVSIVTFSAFFLIMIGSYYFMLPYIYAVIADASGDLVVLISAALAIGSMFGTYFFGLLMEYYGLNTAYAISLALIIIGLLLTIKIERVNIS